MDLFNFPYFLKRKENKEKKEKQKKRKSKSSNKWSRNTRIPPKTCCWNPDVSKNHQQPSTSASSTKFPLWAVSMPRIENSENPQKPAADVSSERGCADRLLAVGYLSFWFCTFWGLATAYIALHDMPFHDITWRFITICWIYDINRYSIVTHGNGYGDEWNRYSKKRFYIKSTRRYADK